MKSSSIDLINNQGKNIQVVVIPIEPGILCLRGLSPERIRFELEYALERGSTDNSFLFSEKKTSQSKENPSAILIHPPGAIYAEEFIPALRNALPEHKANLQVVVGHVNPNRVSLLRELTKTYPNLELIASNPGAKLLKELWSQQKPSKSTNTNMGQNINSSIPPFPKIKTIKQEITLEGPNNYQIKLIPAPTPRWPGGLLAFEEGLGLLMSDKFCAAHICTEIWSESNRSSTEEERRHFYDCLMASMHVQVSTIAERLEELDIKVIAPCHGPSIETSWRSLLSDYRVWGENQAHADLKVLLLFASAYGNTAAIADALANGVRRTGVRINCMNCEFTPANDLITGIQEADAYLIGSPTLGGHAPTPIVSALGTLLAEGDKEKPVGIFGSFGWSGEALDLLEAKLKDGGFKFGFKPIKVKFSPNTEMVKTIEETGVQFGRKLIKEQTKQRLSSGGLSSSRSDPTVLAIGRIVGSLCLLTTSKESGSSQLNSAMIASWVSQASFNPPGLTVAVAKDRAVEALLHCGDHFTLNVLAAKRKNKIMKQFLQPFQPGEDRFAGLNLDSSPTGQPIIPEALAWLEGHVKQRMECGDHWLIYAEVKHGKVLDSEGVTAVHHRRTGATY